MNRARPVRWGIQLVIGCLISGVTLWWAFRGLDPCEVLTLMGNASPGWLVLAVGCVLGVSAAKAARWRQLYARPKASLAMMFVTLVVAQAVNIVIPIRLGEVVRIGLMRQAGHGSETLSTIVLEKVVDLVVAGVVAVLLVSIAIVPAWLADSSLGMLGVGVALLAGLLAAWRFRAPLEHLATVTIERLPLLPRRWRKRLRRWMRVNLEGLGTVTQLDTFASVLGWTGAVWLFSILTMVALIAAFGLNVPLVAAVVLMLTVNFSNLAPAPGLVGVIQLIAVVVLSFYGVERALAASFGTVLNLIVVAPLLIIGSWGLWIRSESIAMLKTESSSR